MQSKAHWLKGELTSLAKRICNGDESELLVWVIPEVLACAHRPLRYHHKFGGRGRCLPADATPEVYNWVQRVKQCEISSIICLMDSREIKHYSKLALNSKDLIEFYKISGFAVRHIPLNDPAHRPHSDSDSFRENLIRVKKEALAAFCTLPKPVLLHCSAGIDRSSPVAAFIWSRSSAFPLDW